MLANSKLLTLMIAVLLAITAGCAYTSYTERSTINRLIEERNNIVMVEQRHDDTNATKLSNIKKQLDALDKCGVQ